MRIAEGEEDKGAREMKGRQVKETAWKQCSVWRIDVVRVGMAVGMAVLVFGRAAADGMVAASVGRSVAEAAQKAVILDLGDGNETLLLQVTYSGTAGDFAWVVPVPRRPVPNGIASGSGWFVKRLYEETAPRVVTYEAEPETQMLAGGPAMEAARRGGRVIVWQTLRVGPYQAQVLEATGPGVLARWLEGHGYRLPEGAGEVLEGYVRQGWYFVAVKVVGGWAGRLRQGDLPPLAITFPKQGDGLIYPLTISRASSRERCAVDLVIISPQPVGCREMELDFPPEEYKKLRRKTIWKRLCEMSEDGRRGVVLWRGSWTPMPEGARPEFLAAAPQWHGLWCQRVWAMVPANEMRDLHFEPMQWAKRGQVTVSRTRYVNERVAALKRSASIKYRHARRAVEERTNLGPLSTNAIVAISIGAAVVIALVGLVVFRVVRGILLSILPLIVALVVLTSTSMAGMFSRGETSWRQWEVAAGQMHQAVLRFVDAFGAYPLRAADLLKEKPKWGQDESGNRVRLKGATGWRPMRTLPVDPLTGRRGTWLIDLASPELVTSTQLGVAIWMVQFGKHVVRLERPLLPPR